MYQLEIEKSVYMKLINCLPELISDVDIQLITCDENLASLGFVKDPPCLLQIDITSEQLEALLEELIWMETEAYSDEKGMEEESGKAYERYARYGWLYDYLYDLSEIDPVWNQQEIVILEEVKEKHKMKKTYITLTGTNHYHGKDFLEPGMKVKLMKEPENEFDKEAIRIEMTGIGKLGYVANSTYTVLGESISAGRLYDQIGKKASAKIKYITPRGVILKVCKKDLK